MQKKMNLGGLLGQAQKMATNGDSQKNGDPTEDKIKAAKLQLQMSQDYKKLNKKDFKTKYDSLNPDDKKILGIKGEEDLNSLINDLKDGIGVFIEGEEGIQNDINKYTKQYETIKSNKIKQEQEQEQEKVKQEQLFNTSKTDLDNYNKLKSSIKEKYKYDVDSKPVDFRKSYNEGIIKEANERIKTRNDVKVPGNPTNENTCISGVCTLAANQGVDFSKMAGAGLGIKDAQGRVIPVQNKAFYENLDKSGYEEIPYEQRQEGDMVQYDEYMTEADEKLGKMTPGHMEVLLNKGQGNNADRYFNNFSLTNYNKDYGFKTPGESFRKLQKDKNGRIIAVNTDTDFDAMPNARVLRIKDDAVKAAYLKTHPEYKAQLEAQQDYQSSPDYNSYTELNNKIESLKKTNPDLYKKLTTTPTETTSGVKN